MNLNSVRYKLTYIFIGSLTVTVLASLSFLFSGNSDEKFALHGAPLDDVWIHHVYARSIAAGHPFEYNPGELETGSTSPLWAFILAPLYWLGFPVIVSSKFLCIVFTALVATIGYKLAFNLGENIVGYFFALGFPLIPYYTFTAVSGTEVPLFIFLTFLTIVFTLSKKLIPAGLSAGFTILARPEGFILVCLLLLSVAISNYNNLPSNSQRILKTVKSLASVFISIVIVLTPWILFCMSVTGKPLPMTFYAKAHWFGLANLDQFSKISSLLLSQPFMGTDIEISAITALAFLASVIIYIYGLSRLRCHGLPTMIMIGFAGPVFLYAVSVIIPLGNPIGADQTNSVNNFYFARYLLPGFAPILFVWLIGMRAIFQQKSHRNIVIASLVIMLSIASTIHQHIQLRGVYSWNCKNIEELQVRTAKWIAGNIPQGTTIAVSDAGAIRYFGNHRVIDLIGLNTHRLLSLTHAINDATDRSEENQVHLNDFWKNEHPDYFAVINGWHEPLVSGYSFEKLCSFRIAHNTICGGDEILILKPHFR